MAETRNDDAARHVSRRGPRKDNAAPPPSRKDRDAAPERYPSERKDDSVEIRGGGKAGRG